MNWANTTLMLAITAMALAIGGGIYEGMVINPQWSKNIPQSLSLVQEGSGIPLQKFWIPIHIAITITLLAAIILNWTSPTRRLFILIGIGSYIVMRAWSFAYFIPEMLEFQKIAMDSSANADLIERVRKWTTLTHFREPLDFITFGCLLWSLSIENRYD
ncbi:hypothetical protein [Bdellovibrio bacteriovorus]|uniref:hypothetical protein n=1 Tax=Bdellovibrio bacteriovorus TaxID=959 RepID=UPI0035A84834